MVDAAGLPVSDAEVTYTLNGGPTEVAECIDWGDEGCSTWGVGTEQTGIFFVKVEATNGTSGTSGAYVLGGDCGVQTQELRVVVE